MRVMGGGGYRMRGEGEVHKMRGGRGGGESGSRCRVFRGGRKKQERQQRRERGGIGEGIGEERDGGRERETRKGAAMADLAVGLVVT
jgi:hypothetical protein